MSVHQLPTLLFYCLLQEIFLLLQNIYAGTADLGKLLLAVWHQQGLKKTVSLCNTFPLKAM
jgi:hypothetical protein